MRYDVDLVHSIDSLHYNKELSPHNNEAYRFMVDGLAYFSMNFSPWKITP